MVLPDGGVQIQYPRIRARNAAAFVLAAVDEPDVATAGANCGDPTS